MADLSEHEVDAAQEDHKHKQWKQPDGGLVAPWAAEDGELERREDDRGGDGAEDGTAKGWGQR